MKRFALFILASLPAIAFAALSVQSAFDVRSTGSDSNGGCFLQVGVGTDYTQQGSPQYSFTDLTVDAVVNTRVKSTSHNFVTSDTNNCINITTSTSGGWTYGVYQIISLTGSEANLDRSPAAVNTTNGHWNEGGGFLTLAMATTTEVLGNTVFLDSSTYELNTPLLAPANVTYFYGFNTKHFDGGYTTLQATTSLSYMFSTNSHTSGLDHVIVDCNSQASTLGIEDTTSSGDSIFSYLKIKNCTYGAFGYSGGGGSQITMINSEIYNISGASIAVIMPSNSDEFIGNYVHDNTTPGALDMPGSGVIVTNNIFSNNVSTCVTIAQAPSLIYGNIIDHCGADGILQTDSLVEGVFNNLLTFNGRYGLDSTVSSVAFPWTDGNCYYNNTSGNIHNLSALNSSLTGYVNKYDQILSTTPYVNVAIAGGVLTAANFALNNLPGGGASCKNVAVPTSWPDLTLTNYADMGAAGSQRQRGYSFSR